MLNTSKRQTVLVEKGFDPKYNDGTMIDEKPRQRQRRSRRLIWIVALTIILIALALGLGLGLGLTLKHRGDDDSSDDSSSDSGSGSSGTPSTSASLPNRTITDRTFWQPAVNSSWQIVLLSPLKIDAEATSTTPDVGIFDIDLFTNPDATIDKLHALGKKVICYFSAGSYEPNRPDSSNFTSSDKGKELDGWPGEYWLNTKSQNVRNIMSERIKIASNRGCDGIDPDNVDGWTNENGLGLTSSDAINFIQFLSNEASTYNMSVGLKNAGDIIPNVLNFTHFAVNEQCVQYSECAKSSPFIQAGKPVFNIEYPDGAGETGETIAASKVSSICSRTGASAGANEFSTVMKRMDLNGWVEYCDKSIAVTAT